MSRAGGIPVVHGGEDVKFSRISGTLCPDSGTGQRPGAAKLIRDRKGLWRSW